MFWVINLQCNLCPRNCNIDRNENTGFCKSHTKAKIARIAPHHWEEPCISGTKGSGTVFFSGCTLKCVFCQNYEISALNQGREITPYELSEEYKRLEQLGVHNINLVSACHFIPSILESFEIYTKLNGEYKKVGNGTVIGSKKILFLKEKVKTSELLIAVTGTRENPVIRDIAFYN